MKKLHLISFPFIAIGLFVGYAFLVSAAAPSGGYTPGATLDPDCAPGDADCIVIAGGSSQWTDVAAGTDLIQVTGSGLDDVTSSGDYNYFGQFGLFVVGNAGDTMLAIENRTDGFANGQIITGGTSGAAGTVRFFTEIPEAYVFLENVTGTFVPGEVISNFDNGGTADVLSATVTTADSFIWQEQDIPEVGILEMTGSAQTLFDSFSVTWGSTSGHTVGDQWALTITQSGIAYDSGAVGIGTLAPIAGLSVNGTVLIGSNTLGLELQNPGDFLAEFDDPFSTLVSRIYSIEEGGVGLQRGNTDGNIGSFTLGDDGGLNYAKHSSGFSSTPDLLFRLGDGSEWGGSSEENKFFFDNGINSGSPSIRLGSVDDDNWDQSNRGNRSIAIGFALPADILGPGSPAFPTALASGTGSIALGSSTTASGILSLSYGLFSEASGGTSIALGNQVLASGETSLAMGNESLASGTDSIAIGDSVMASGVNSYGFGVALEATGERSLALGSGGDALGDYSVSIGGGIAEANYSIALGGGTASGYSSLSLIGGRAYSSYETAIGGVTPYTPIETGNSYNLSDRLFVIGNSFGTDSDAFTILKSGQIGIGIDNFETIADASALLTLGSTTQGFLAPRMTQGQRDAIFSPATGLFAYNTDTNKFNFYNGTAWSSISGLDGSTNSFGTETWLGSSAGANSGSTNDTVFIGYGAGNSASGAVGTVIIGSSAGGNAVNAENSVFIGLAAGQQAENAENALFLGLAAGGNATNAANSIFLGAGTGASAINAQSSIFIGISTGYLDTVDNSLGGSSILIGNYASTGGFSNSIALGSNATNTASNQLMIGSSSDSPIDFTVIKGTGGTQCTITTGTGMACTSDERLKTNIQDLSSSTLDDLLNVRTVTYNWKSSPNGDNMIGFLAQDLEQYFPELVSTNERGQKSVYYAQMTPVLVEAIRELDLKISDIEDFATDGNSFGDTLRNWFADATNGIQKIFVKEVETENIKTKDIQTDNLCVGQVCVTQEQFLNIVNQSNQIPSVPTPEPDLINAEPEPSTDTSAQESESEISPVEDSVITPDPAPEEITVEPEPIVSEEQAPVETPSETVSE